MIEIIKSAPFMIWSVENHAELKPVILKLIEQMGINPYTSEHEKLANTDWHLADSPRPYCGIVGPIMEETAARVTHHYNYPKNMALEVLNYWFQQYQEGDFHDWHIHGKSVFSSIYYVELPEGSAKTSFRLIENEFTVDVKEGDVLTFPACFLHSSAPTKANRKTVVAFNM